MNKRDNGQYFAFEVSRVDQQLRGTVQPAAEHEYIATLWDKGAAEQLSSVVNGDIVSHIPPGAAVKRIGVVVLENNAFYDTAKPPVPVELVANDVAEAISAALIRGFVK